MEGSSESPAMSPHTPLLLCDLLVLHMLLVMAEEERKNDDTNLLLEEEHRNLENRNCKNLQPEVLNIVDILSVTFRLFTKSYI